MGAVPGSGFEEPFASAQGTGCLHFAECSAGRDFAVKSSPLAVSLSSARRRSSRRPRPAPRANARGSGRETPRRLSAPAIAAVRPRPFQRFAFLQFRVGGRSLPACGRRIRGGAGVKASPPEPRPGHEPPLQAGGGGGCRRPRPIAPAEQSGHRAVARTALPLVLEVAGKKVLFVSPAPLARCRLIVRVSRNPAPRNSSRAARASPLCCVRLPAGHRNSIRYFGPVTRV